jgi:hypothetical protein
MSLPSPSTIIPFIDLPDQVLQNGVSLPRRGADGSPILYGTGPLFMTDDPWSLAFLAGDPLPGINKVHGLPTLAFDRKKSAGVDGAVLTVNGYLPGPIEFEFLMWTQQQWEWFLDVIAPKVWRTPKKRGRVTVTAAQLDSDPANDPLGVAALTITSPGLSTWRIAAAVIIGVSVPEPGPQPQTLLVKLKSNELVFPDGKKATTTPKKAARNVPLAPEVDPSANRPGRAPPSQTDTGPI